MGFTVYSAAGHKAGIARCNGSGPEGALPFSHVIPGDIGGIYVSLLVQVILDGTLDGCIGYIDCIGLGISIGAFGNGRICAINYFYRALSQVLDHRLSGIGDIGKVFQVLDITRIGGNVRFIRVDLGIQGSQVRGCRICGFDIVPIGCRMGFRVHRTAGDELLISGCHKACADGFAPFFFVGRLFFCRCCIAAGIFQVLADVGSIYICFQRQFAVGGTGFFGNHAVYIADVGSIALIGVRIGSIGCGEAALDVGDLVAVHAHIAAADGSACSTECDFAARRVAGSLAGNRRNASEVFGQLNVQVPSCRIVSRSGYYADIPLCKVRAVCTAGNAQGIALAGRVQFGGNGGICRITCDFQAIVQVGNILLFSIFIGFIDHTILQF